MNIFSQSWQGQNLTPGQRAFLKLFEGWLFTAIGTGVAIASQLLVTGNTDYNKIFLVAGGAATKTLYDAVKKYLSAQTDVPLPVAGLANQATDLAIQEVQKITPPPPPQPPVIIHNNMPPMPPLPEPRIIQVAAPAFSAPAPQTVPQFKAPMPTIADINTNVMPAIPMTANGRDWTGLELTAVQS